MAKIFGIFLLRGAGGYIPFSLRIFWQNDFPYVAFCGFPWGAGGGTSNTTSQTKFGRIKVTDIGVHPFANIFGGFGGNVGFFFTHKI